MTETDSRISALLKRACESLRKCDLDAAEGAMNEALKVSFDDGEVLYSLKCAEFWKERKARCERLSSPFEQGDFMLVQWKSFRDFRARLGGDHPDVDFAFRQYAFLGALARFKAFACEYGDSCESDLSLRLGRCLKGAGDYVAALGHLDQAARLKRDDPEILSELADVYSLMDESKAARALFREAFFLGPSRIDLDSVESVMIRKLAERLSAEGFKDEDIPEWIPVYGVLWNVFTVKRELKPIDFGKLKQSIYQLETDLKERQDQRRFLVPRLLNRYFWLLDHYLAVREAKAGIDEVLLKIKLLDAQVYKLYTA